MSEHQYYEFQAIDRLLDAQTQEELRAISTRAEITAHSLVNTYHWGSFKGSADALVERCFDLFLYFANWGTRRLKLRLPLRYLDLDAIQTYRIKDMLQVRTTGEHAILTIEREIEEPAADDPYIAPSAGLAALRGEMLRGSLCPLYLTWLLAVQDERVSESALEPPCPPGLASASTGLEAFAEFFELDRNLWAVASRHPRATLSLAPEPTEDELRSFMSALGEAEKNELICRAVLERDPHVRLSVERAWEKAVHGNERSVTSSEPRRSAGELLASARMYAVDRDRIEWERRAEDQRVAKERRLAVVAAEGVRAWDRVKELAGSRRGYDDATELLSDLRALAERAGTLIDFQRTLGELRRNWVRQPSLIRRLREAGL